MSCSGRDSFSGLSTCLACKFHTVWSHWHHQSVTSDVHLSFLLLSVKGRWRVSAHLNVWSWLPHQGQLCPDERGAGQNTSGSFSLAGVKEDVCCWHDGRWGGTEGAGSSVRVIVHQSTSLSAPVFMQLEVVSTRSSFRIWWLLKYGQDATLMPFGIQQGHVSECVSL